MKLTRSAKKVTVESVFSRLDDNEKNRFIALKSALESIRKDISSRFRDNKYVIVERIGKAAKANDGDRLVSEIHISTNDNSSGLGAPSHFLYLELKRKGMIFDTPLVRSNFEYAWKEDGGLIVVLNVAVNLKAFSSMNTARFSGVPYDNIIFCDIREHRL